MRALCGAIITAGALIGLGLFGVGMGLRYQNLTVDTAATALAAEAGKPRIVPVEIRFRDLDNPMKVASALLIASLAIGLGIAFFGLALHHERRVWERTHPLGEYPAAPTSGASTPAGTHRMSPGA